jgi:hypothetical protein
VFATLLTLGVLSLFRLIENRIPAEFYAHFNVRFERDEIMPEPEMRQLLDNHGFTIANLNYWLDANANFFEYGMVIRTNRGDNATKLTETLSKIASIKEFRVSPTGDRPSGLGLWPGGGAAAAFERLRSGGQFRFLTSTITHLVTIKCRVIDSFKTSKPPGSFSVTSPLIWVPTWFWRKIKRE